MVTRLHEILTSEMCTVDGEYSRLYCNCVITIGHYGNKAELMVSIALLNRLYCNCIITIRHYGNKAT